MTPSTRWAYVVWIPLAISAVILECAYQLDWTGAWVRDLAFASVGYFAAGEFLGLLIDNTLSKQVWRVRGELVRWGVAVWLARLLIIHLPGPIGLIVLLWLPFHLAVKGFERDVWNLLRGKR